MRNAPCFKSFVESPNSSVKRLMPTKIAFLPAVVLGLLFGKAIKAHLFTPVVVASTFQFMVRIYPSARASILHSVGA